MSKQNSQSMGVHMHSMYSLTVRGVICLVSTAQCSSLVQRKTTNDYIAIQNQAHKDRVLSAAKRPLLQTLLGRIRS